MTDTQRLGAISMNLVRISALYYKDQKNTVEICQRFLDQAKRLAAEVQIPAVQPYLRQLHLLSLQPGDESVTHTAERFLTLGSLLQDPEHWGH